MKTVTFWDVKASGPLEVHQTLDGRIASFFRNKDETKKAFLAIYFFTGLLLSLIFVPEIEGLCYFETSVNSYYFCVYLHEIFDFCLRYGANRARKVMSTLHKFK